MYECESDCEQEFTSASTLRYFPVESMPELPASLPLRKMASRSEQLHELSLMMHEPEAESGPAIIRLRPSEDNQRQFARCPISQDGTPAILTVKGRQVGCHLVEMSIGGFGVVIAGSPRFECGTECQLQARGLNYIVRISRREERPEGTFFGLQQVEEIIHPRQYLTGQYPQSISLLVAAVAGALIVTLAYSFMNP